MLTLILNETQSSLIFSTRITTTNYSLTKKVLLTTLAKTFIFAMFIFLLRESKK